jgi:hypothetical protein
VADFLQFAESMTIEHTHACFEVMDRNLNMASVIALIDFDLRTGGVTSSITVAEHCPSLDDAAREALPCMQALRGRARVRELARTRRRVARAWRLGVVRGSPALLGPARQRQSLAIEAPILESISPDGRWAVMSGDRDDGDFVYRRLWMLDLVRGRVFPIASDDASPRQPWPAPIAPRALSDHDAMVTASIGATGETSVWWRGPTLVIGERLLITPGRSIVTLPGALVR